MKNALRPYQEQAKHHVMMRILDQQYRIYVSLPTGTGKSVLMAAIAQARLDKGRVLILIHRQDIALQLWKTLRNTELNVGLLMQGHRTLTAPVTVATTQSLTPMLLHELLQASEQPVSSILIDEAHHAIEHSAYAQIVTVVEEASFEKKLPVVGFTATPYRYDKHSMLSLLPICAFERTIPDMVQEGWLAPLTWKPIHVDIDLSQVVTDDQTGESDYLPDALAPQLVRHAITKEIVRHVASEIEQRPTLVFAVSIEHAEQLAEEFRQQGFGACSVSGRQRLAERGRVFEDWRAQRVQIVCNCSLLTEGFDFPAIAALVIARPTRSPGFYLQMLGRGTRPAPGKTDCLVLDVMGNNPHLSSQIGLPQVVGDSKAQGSRTFQGPANDPLLKAINGAKTGASLSLLDPIGQSWYRWTPYHLDPYQGYFAKVSQFETAIIERDLHGSGLYRSRLHIHHPQLVKEDRWICQDYYPLRQQVALVHEGTNRTYVKELGGKEASWLKKKASEKQLQTLHRMYPRAARHAQENAWTQQQVSDAITFLLIKWTLTHPPEKEEATNEGVQINGASPPRPL